MRKGTTLGGIAIGGTVIAAITFIFIRPIAARLGAEGMLLDYCVTYGRILLITLPFFMLQFEFQNFLSLHKRMKRGRR